LGKHPDVQTYGEILFPTVTDPVQTEFGFYYWYLQEIRENPSAVLVDGRQRVFGKYIDWLRAKTPTKVLFVDLKLEQLAWEAGAFSSGVYKPEYKFIILQRRNLLRVIVSAEIMNKRISAGDKVVHRNYVPEKMVIRLDPEEVVRMIRQKQDLLNRYAQRPKQVGAPFIEVDYEDLSGDDADSQFRRIQEFMGVEPRTLQAGIVRQNPYALDELIENFDEVARRLKSAGFSHMLETT